MMTNTFFIASRLRYKRRIITVSIAISYIVMIVAIAVSSGFRNEVRDALAEMGGDIQLSPSSLSVSGDENPIDATPSYLPLLENVDGVAAVEPAIYKAGIVKAGDDIYGVIMKGVETSDTLSLAVSIPRRLSERSGLRVGDRMLTYFVGEKMKARNFRIASIYDPLVEADDRIVVYADIRDLQRLNGWSENEVSMLEIRMEPRHRDEIHINEATQEVGYIAYSHTNDDQTGVFASSAMSRYPQLFDWLDLIDFNVLFVLVLMIVVAGFNMISGLLITLFENISTIGVFKAMGMTDRYISNIFLTSSAALVLKGMAWGNAVALLFCLLQDKLHILKLDPANYFLPFVPVDVDVYTVVAVDVISFVVIMLLLLIPCAFISKVDPAETVRVR